MLTWHAQVPLAVKEALEAEAAGAPEGAPPPAPLRFPLACGEPRAAQDAEGAPCTVVDVVYAAKAVAAAAGDAKLKAFLIGLALAHVGGKHGLSLDARYKLPRRRYMDEPVRPQRVRDDTAGPRIRELPDDSGGKSVATKAQPQPAAAAAAKASASPLFAKAAPRATPPPAAAAAAASGFSVEFEGRPCAALLCHAPLPPALAAAARSGGGGDAPPVRLALSRRALEARACAPGGGAAIFASLPLPYEVDARRATAWLEAAPGGVALVARLPVRPYGDVARDAAARPSAAIDLSSARYLELID